MRIVLPLAIGAFTVALSACKADLRVATQTRSAIVSPSFEMKAAPCTIGTSTQGFVLVWPGVDGAASYLVKTSSDPDSKDCTTGVVTSTTVTSATTTLASSNAASVCVAAIDHAGSVIASSYFSLASLPSPSPVPVSAPVVIDAALGSLSFTTSPRALVAGSAPLNAVRVGMTGASATVLAAKSTLTLTAMIDATCQTPMPGFTPMTASAVQGTAEFPNLTITKAGTAYLEVTGKNFLPACSPALVVSAAAARTLQPAATVGFAYAAHVLPLSFVALDAYQNPVPSTRLNVNVVAGGGSCTSCSGNTDASGMLAFGWLVGPTEGTTNTLTVSLPSVSTFTVTSTALNYYCDQAAAGAFQAGSGTTADPFVICTPAQLAHIGTDSTLWSQSYRLERDLDLSTYDATTPAKTILPIGQIDTASPGAAVAYNGSFDGNNHTIDHFTVGAGAGSTSVGLFGNTSGATIKNLTITNALVVTDGSSYAAILVGNALNTAVDHVVISGALTATNGYGHAAFFGVLIAAAGSSSLTNSSTSAVINGSDRVGAVAGVMGSSAGGSIVISQVNVDGSVNSASGGNTFGSVIGALNADSGGQASVSHVVSHADVTITIAGSFSGGFIGQATSTDSGSLLTFTDCLQAGNFTSTLDASFYAGDGGGFAGILAALSGGQLIMNRVGVTGNVHITSAGGVSLIGGFAGNVSTQNGGGANITFIDSYSTAIVTADSTSGSQAVSGFAGGLGTRAAGTETVVLTRVYALGSYQGVMSGTPGGLGGNNWGVATGTTFTDCYWNSAAFAAGFGNLGTQPGMTGESLADLKLQATYTNWDFTSIWQANAGATPSLR